MPPAEWVNESRRWRRRTRGFKSWPHSSRPISRLLGKDAGLVAGIGEIGVPLGVVGESNADVVIDFSVPDAAVAVVAHCVDYSRPVVVATTGLDNDQQEYLRKSAQKIPIVWSPNMSTAVNVAMKLTEVAGKSLRDLPTGVDVEIHRAPPPLQGGRAERHRTQVRPDRRRRDGHRRNTRTAAPGRPGPRPRNEIGYHAIRAGDNPGEHTIIFGMLGETIELRVAATNRDCYAQGALLAAEWLVGKPPGLYGMNDVLGL